ncbi:DUF3515 domain-containing protein [Williamsia sp. DF01-3]|uniref:DUF3515 domain-containing protein n=1 Tax=Williamsia sp. DF01-3 TaxID=2934157 RepID=UPI001FF2E88B|nr:DUF3515 domain-containing protein [Williamsia sp. DF01-3]MCK0519415.1 DUF3515 domain-containing protein [Williamsia sp. DF01-3]
MSDSSTRRLSPAVIASIVAIPVMVIVGFITYAVVGTDGATSDDTPLKTMAAPERDSPECAKLIAALPESFDGFGKRETAADGLVTWAPGDQVAGPVQVRCGVDRPESLSPTSGLQVVDPVQWFSVSATTEAKGFLWYAVDHRPYVAIWLPENVGNGPIQQVSQLIDQNLTSAPIDLGG